VINVNLVAERSWQTLKTTPSTAQVCPFMIAAGKIGKRFKPAVSIGVMGVAGMWFGIGSVVAQSMAAAGYVAVSVLLGGLVQAGEALLSGRSINVLRKFAAGYSFRLADMTSPSTAMTDAQFTRIATGRMRDYKVNFTMSRLLMMPTGSLFWTTTT